MYDLDYSESKAVLDNFLENLKELELTQSDYKELITVYGEVMIEEVFNFLQNEKSFYVITSKEKDIIPAFRHLIIYAFKDPNDLNNELIFPENFYACHCSANWKRLKQGKPQMCSHYIALKIAIKLNKLIPVQIPIIEIIDFLNERAIDNNT